MKIHKSHKLREQVKLANRVQAELVRLITKKISRAKQRGEDFTAWEELLLEVSLTAESFRITFKSCAAKDVDRRASMLCGPFFTSESHAMPMGNAGPLMPVVQLDLSALAVPYQETLGDGLLQLWYDPAAQKELIRLIPLADAYAQEVSEFKWDTPREAESSFPLPWNLSWQPLGDAIQVMTGLTSTGVQSNYSAIEMLYFEATEDEDDWLWALLKLFCSCTPEKGSDAVTMFGTHSSIQYGAWDVKMKRLIGIRDWGSTGHAQIFYQSIKGKPTEFSFWSCVR